MAPSASRAGRLPGATGVAPTPLCAPSAADGSKHRAELQAPQKKEKIEREGSTVGRPRPAPPPAGSGCARGWPSGPVPSPSRGLRVSPRGIALRSLSCSCGGSGDPGHRQRERAGGGTRPGGTRPGGGSERRLVPPRPWPRGQAALRVVSWG